MKKLSPLQMESTKGGLLFELLAILVLVGGVALGLGAGSWIGSKL